MRLQNLAEVCRRLNQQGVKYVLVGGFAVLIHGFERATRDIDFVVDPSDENIEKVRVALKDLLPEATAEMRLGDVRDYVVLRLIGEDLVVDLIKEIGAMDYEKIILDSFVEEVDGVPILVAGLDSMIELKKGIRDRDQRDYLFLVGKKEYLEKHKK